MNRQNNKLITIEITEIDYIDADNQTKTMVAFDNLNYIQ